MRTVTIPQTSVIEDIRLIEEIAGEEIRLFVGKKLENGNWVPEQQYESYTISGDDFAELNGPATAWAPDKPEGTYRNQDLWYFIDKIRNTNA